ncbi:MAG: hypothetical protein GTO67_15160 [Gammaproteobacteria bacterium]|nr:hypothetical protein [Gammaproteobacteria bacterium]NIM73480.1 hypothetical protein [Gammaproteobacteria bacterium]NIN39889.1 hypothetical protein [Gammaproteobacteria bacterium]NIO25289.1 hypothetical protein [Gammaproteobacteria bacterium]NIO65916.1 hypothetical protein [Gammaproteobacteria bacterium]
MNAANDLPAILRAHLGDRASSWSIGGYGAIAEFHWLPDDRVGTPPGAHLEVATDAGALRLALRDDIVPHTYQGLSRHPDRWLQGISLCLPWRRARLAGRTALTELGDDRHAIRPADRDAVLFDMGLGLPHVDACVRTRSTELTAILRAHCGRALLEPGSVAMAAIKDASPHRVFVSRLGRVEVYQRIGSPRMQPPTPLGPHTHVLPRLLAARRANVEDDDAPPYHRACVYLYPGHPLMDALGNRTAYDRRAHENFSALMQRWGDPVFMAEKRRATAAMRARICARDYQAPADRRGRHALRIAIRELAQEAGETPIIANWRARFDRVRPPSHPHLVH